MDKATRRRWAILLGTAAITAVASFYPADVAHVSNLHMPIKQISNLAVKVVADKDAMLDAAPSGADPFAPSGWQPLPPPEPIRVTPVTAAPLAPPAPVGPPPLPFKFMGRLNDEGVQVIYLSQGEQTFIAHSGDTLADTYKVLSIDDQRIEFEHLPTGEKQTLTIPTSEN